MIQQIRRILASLVLLTMAFGSVCTSARAADSSDSGAANSVLSFSELVNGATLPKLEGPSPILPAAISVTQKQIGVPLKTGKFTLEELSQRGGPAILHLSNPEQFVAIAAVGPKFVSLYDRGAISVVDRSEIKDRYGNEAFILSLPDNSKPSLKFDDPVPVVKVVSGGGEVTREVKVTNTGSKPISLEVESTSCGCTVAHLSSNLLNAGQTGILQLKMQVGAWGNKTERATLKTSDPYWPQAVIAFQVQVPTTVVPTPSHLNIETPQGHAEERALFIILPANATVTKVTTQHSFVKATLDEIQSIDDGNAQKVKISVTSAAPLGDFKDSATFELKGAEVPRIEVPIEGTIQSDIEVSPQQLFLGQIGAGKTIHKTFIVESRSGRTFSIQGIKSDTASITPKPAGGITASAHAIEFIIAVPAQIDSVVDSKIEVTLSDGQKLSVPVFGMVVPEKTRVEPKLKLGELAPDFSISDMVGNPVKLSDFRGKKNLVLTFFPKCFTGGCAGQLASLQQEHRRIGGTETEIIAVSVDAASEQIAFATKLGLKFPLIPDTHRDICMLYGAVEQSTDLAQRMSILIDKQGIVRWIDTDVHVQTHGADVLAKLKEFGMK